MGRAAERKAWEKISWQMICPNCVRRHERLVKIHHISIKAWKGTWACSCNLVEGNSGSINLLSMGDLTTVQRRSRGLFEMPCLSQTIQVNRKPQTDVKSSISCCAECTLWAAFKKWNPQEAHWDTLTLAESCCWDTLSPSETHPGKLRPRFPACPSFGCCCCLWSSAASAVSASYMMPLCCFYFRWCF